MNIKVELKEPFEGFETEAVLRTPMAGDWYISLSSGDKPYQTKDDWEFCERQLCLTKKKSLAESLGLEVGACYFKAGRNLYEVVSDYQGRYHGTRGSRGSTQGCDGLVGCCVSMEGNWRKVINPDGTLVDGNDDVFVTIGGFDVPKADLFERYEYAIPF